MPLVHIPSVLGSVYSGVTDLADRLRVIGFFMSNIVYRVQNTVSYIVIRHERKKGPIIWR